MKIGRSLAVRSKKFVRKAARTSGNPDKPRGLGTAFNTEYYSPRVKRIGPARQQHYTMHAVFISTLQKTSGHDLCAALPRGYFISTLWSVGRNHKYSDFACSRLQMCSE